MALTYKEQNSDSTKYYLDRALEIKQKLHNPELLYKTSYELAEWNFQRGALDQVNYWGEQAKNIYHELIVYPDHFEIYYLLSRANLKNPEYLDLYLVKYHDESSLFFDKQQDIIKQLQGFHTDLIQAGFELEQKAITLQAEFNRNLSLIALIIVVTVVSAYWIHRRRKERTMTRRTKEIRSMLYGDEDPE